jgi:signal transduction histidine kinase
MTRIAAPEDVGALWLQTLQRAVGRASHDVKDALNGVSVNLEVIRSRSARADAPASAVAQFGEAAAHQLERLTSLTEAVLALARADRQPADVGVTLRRVATLCDASASSADAAVVLVGEVTGSALTRVHGDVVRLAITAPLLEIVAGADRWQRATEVTCTIGSDDDTICVVITAPDRRAVMPKSVADAVRGAGVRWTEGERDLSLAFPRA